MADSATQPGDNISTLVNDAGFITNSDIFRFNVAADDSTVREITKDETVKFVGAQNVTTASDAEGNITITGPDLSSYLTSYTETDPVVGAINGIVKADGAGNISAAVAGTDYSTFDGVFASLTSKPTTLSGYGITDAYTQAQIDAKVAAVVDSAPDQLDTLNELAAALNDDANFATTITNRFTVIENNVFAIGADDSTLRTVKQGEGIKIIGGTNLSTSSDAEGNITVDFVNPGYITAGLESGDNVSELVNDAGYFTRLFVAGDDSTVRTLVKDETIQFQGTGSTTTSTDADGNVIIDSGNESITLFGDVSGSGTTSINVTLASSPVSPGTYNKVTVDTKGIVQSAELVDYLVDGNNVSRLTNDAGYLTNESSINFNVVGDDSTGFNMANQGTFQFTGTNGITVTAASDATTPTVTIDGNAFVQTGDNISTLVNDTGYYKQGSTMIGDLTGSVFADDSSLVIDGQTGNLYGTLRGGLIGDVKGSVVGDDSTVVIDGVSGNVVGTVTGTTTGTIAPGATAPSADTDAGTTGEIRVDDTYIYVKTSTVWKRIALQGFA